MYHDVIDAPHPDASGFPGVAPANYKVEVGLFERHLDAIEARAVSNAVGIAEPASTRANQDWLLTFDDGGVSAVTKIAHRLEARGMRGIFFVTTDRVGTPGFLTVAQVRDLAARGHVIGSHSMSHPRRMSSCSRNEVRTEWHGSVRALAEMIEAPVIHASVPNGAFSNVVAEEAAAAGIRTLHTSNPTRRRFQIDRCLVIGRYAVRATSTPDWVAAVAAGDRVPRYAQWAEWKLKGVAKRIAGERYERFRQRRSTKLPT